MVFWFSLLEEDCLFLFAFLTSNFSPFIFMFFLFQQTFLIFFIPSPDGNILIFFSDYLFRY